MASGAQINFAGTTVLLGDNNTGKSTVLEAIELAIGADRLARTQVINEHDFFAGAYQAKGDQPAPKIVIEVVIADLDAAHCQRFRANLEFWRDADKSLIGPGGALEVAQDGVLPAVRIRFKCEYDPDGTNFRPRPGLLFLAPKREFLAANAAPQINESSAFCICVP